MFRLGLFVLLVLSCLVVRPNDLQAQQGDQAQTARFKAFLGSRHYKRLLLQVIAKKDLVLNRACTTGSFMIEMEASTLNTAVEMPEGADWPAKGTWSQKFKVTRCDLTTIENVIVISQNGQQPQVGLLIPGETVASMELMRDAMQGVIPAAYAEAGNRGKKNCKNIRVMDSTLRDRASIVAELKQGRRVTQWFEDWIVDACGEEITVYLRFHWDDGKQGTVFNVRNAPFQ